MTEHEFSTETRPATVQAWGRGRAAGPLYSCSTCSCGSWVFHQNGSNSGRMVEASRLRHARHVEHHKSKEQAMAMIAPTGRQRVLERRREEVERELDNIQRAIEVERARVASLPPEPLFDDPSEPHVIWFVKTAFGFDPATSTRGRWTYSAVRVVDGLWYTTGPRSPKGYSWASLVEWIQRGEPEPVVLWLGTTWEPIPRVTAGPET